MKITVALLLLAAVTHAASPDSKNRDKIEQKPDKRGLVEGNAGIEKRTPVLATAAPPGVEYADTKQNLQDKSPSQQIYATPVPQISKISDFLTGQGPPFQAAIASHLYSPVSVYNPRFDAPSTYEVSAPIPSQLAYSEHRMSMPQKLAKSINFPQSQVITQQSYEQQNLGYEPLVHQIPNNAINNFQSIQYNQAPQEYIEQQQLQYIQDQSNQILPANIQQNHIQQKNQQEQRDLKVQPAPAQGFEKQNIQQVYNDNQQTALSFAKFSFNLPSEVPANYDQNKNQQGHSQLQYSQPQAQPQIQIRPQHQPQQIIQSQPQQYRAQSQPFAHVQYQLQHPTQLPQIAYHAPQELQYQTPQQIQYQPQPQPQIQYQEEQPQFYQQLQHQFLQPQGLQIQAPQYIQAQNYQLQQTQPQQFEKSDLNAKQPVVAEKQYFKQPQLSQQPIQTQLSQQIFPQQQIQNVAYKHPAAIPTFPPVQYFGKFAHSIFPNSQH